MHGRDDAMTVDDGRCSTLVVHGRDDAMTVDDGRCSALVVHGRDDAMTVDDCRCSTLVGEVNLLRAVVAVFARSAPAVGRRVGRVVVDGTRRDDVIVFEQVKEPSHL